MPELNEYSSKETDNRKERLLEAIRSRHIKQYISGSLFVLLLALGWFYPLIGYFIPACMVAGIGLAIRRGRKWCDWMCPRGSFADSYLKSLSPHRHIPHFLRSFPVRIGVLSFLMLMLGYQIMKLWPEPYAIGRFFVVLLTITTIIGIFLAALVHQRSWCYICPIGSLANLVGKHKMKLHMKEDACITCKLCEKTCPMDLRPQELKDNKKMAFSGDCLKCGLCIKSCPKDALFF